MPWPMSQDYNEAIQDPVQCFADAELKRGEAVCNALGLPVPCSGNFADVYAVQCGPRKWAVKCFTRQIPGLQERYVQISKYLAEVQLPFMVDFRFLEQGIRVRGQWYPILKMQWVEGLQLNALVRDNLDKPPVLQTLGQIWLRLAQKLREANLAHCDLQHGNVLLVPGSKAGSVGVKLVDYDGICVPALEFLKTIEVGHAAYQHPQRLKEGTYGLQTDRFAHLAIYTSLRALAAGGRPLWDKFDNGDNLLFKQPDFEKPASSAVFAALAQSKDVEVRKLASVVASAASKPIEEVPLLEDLVEVPRPMTKVQAAVPATPTSLTAAQEQPDSVFASATSGEPPPRRPVRKASKVGYYVAAAAGLFLLLGGGITFALLGGSARTTGPAVADAGPPATPLVRPTRGEVQPTFPTRPATRQEVKIDLAPNKEPETLPNTALTKTYLRFKDKDHVELANTEGLIDVKGEFTIEMWVRLRSGPQVLVGTDSFMKDTTTNQFKTKGWTFRTGPSKGEDYPFSFSMAGAGLLWMNWVGPARQPSDAWHHLAICKAPNRVVLFVDGKLYMNGRCNDEALTNSNELIWLGATRKKGWLMQGLDADFRAFRISSKGLYLTDFAPPPVFGKTADTLLSLDFSAGKGDLLPDLSGHKRDGTIVGAQWVDGEAKQP